MRSKKSRKARFKNKIPKVLDAAYINRLENFGMMQLDRGSIAAELDCSEDELEERILKDSSIANALIRGRNFTIKNAATLVLNAIQGGKDFVIDEKKLDAAKFYLEKHAPQWLKP